MLMKIGNTKVEGEMVLEISDMLIENSTITLAQITLTIPLFIADFNEIECNLGIFKVLKLYHIAFGTRDTHIIYKLNSTDFYLNEPYIQTMLQNNKEGEANER